MSVIKTPLFVLAVRWVTSGQGGGVDVSWKQIHFAVKVSEVFIIFIVATLAVSHAQGSRCKLTPIAHSALLWVFYSLFLLVTTEQVVQNPKHDVIYLKNAPWR